MKQIVWTFAALMCLTTLFSCDNGETYADMKEKEKKAIDRFIQDNEFTGPIKVISQEQFEAQDSTTNVDENEFVLFRPTAPSARPYSAASLNTTSKQASIPSKISTHPASSTRCS